MGRRRWQDRANMVLGLWMLLSPWVLGFWAGANVAASTARVVGAALCLYALIAMFIPRGWEEVCNIILGLYLLVSPWRLGYIEVPRAAANALTVGMLVTVLALRAMLQDTAVRK